MVEFIANIEHFDNVESLKKLLKLVYETGFKYAKLDANICNTLLKTDDYEDIFLYTKNLGIILYSICYDYNDVDLFKNYTNICQIPSNKQDDVNFIKYVKNNFKDLILEIDYCDFDLSNNLYHSYGPFMIMYKIKNNINVSELNKIKYNLGNLNIGYFDDNIELTNTIVVVSHGINYIEKKVELNNCLDKNYIDINKYVSSLI
jgi:sialic acid synthase SpsE